MHVASQDSTTIMFLGLLVDGNADYLSIRLTFGLLYNCLSSNQTLDGGVRYFCRLLSLIYTF